MISKAGETWKISRGPRKEPIVLKHVVNKDGRVIWVFPEGDRAGEQYTNQDLCGLISQVPESSASHEGGHEGPCVARGAE